MRTLTQPNSSHRRTAFTLVELLVVIGIISILIGLLTPAIYSVITKARVTEVKSDIAKIEGAISDFHLKFGMNPPSRITLYEVSDKATSTGWYENTPEAKWSRSIIRRLWPDFNFDLDRDYNQNGAMASEKWTLEGDQCLVFFLGGVWDGTKFNGFSADQRNPFKLNTTTATTIGPFMDFDAERIISNSTVLTYPTPLLNFPVYVDTMPAQQKPYLYASSDEGLGYDSNDVSTPASGSFTLYFLKQKATAGASDPPAWKPETYQIISPGQDGEYGIGGPYMPDQTNRLPTLVVGGTVPPNPSREKENDNITNFSDGVLAP